MRKLWLMLVLACVLGCVGGQAYAAEAKTPVYLNGVKSEITALAVNGVSYLPLRDLAEVFALDINWDGEKKCVELWCLNSGSRLFVEQRQGQRGWLNDEGEPEWDKDLRDMGSYEPLMRQGKVWLPIAYFENMLNMADISWNPEKRGVFIDGIPMWRQGKWTLSDSGRNVDSPADSLGNVWVVLRRGEPIMGSDYLWRLSPTGEKQRICRVWSLSDLKVLGDKCYFLSDSRLMAELNDVYQVDCASGEVVQLGQPDFYYNCGVKDIGGLYVMTNSGEDILPKWWVDAEGAWAVGIDRGALGDEVVNDQELAQASYGLYRLTPGGHELVTKYDLPPKMTEEEQLESGNMVYLPIYVNGLRTYEGAVRMKEYASREPHLGIRDMCNILGCELKWDAETDRLEIVAEGRREIIDAKSGKGVRISIGADGSEKREEYSVNFEKYGEQRQLPWSFYQGLNGARLEWDKAQGQVNVEVKDLDRVLAAVFIWPKVYVDGREKNLGLRYGKFGNGEVYLDLRQTVICLGGETSWLDEDKLEIKIGERRDIIDTKNRQGVRIVTGADGSEQRQEYAVDIKEYLNNWHYINWRFFEGLNGAKISWDEGANRVDITTK